MHLNYLDAENELASNDILAELNISTGFGLQENEWHQACTEESNTDNRWLAEGGREFSGAVKIAYLVLSGAIYFDVRDSGDHWIRCHMCAGEFIDVPAGLYHRAVFKNGISARYSLNVAKAESTADLIPRFRLERDGWQIVERHSYRSLICDLCQQFFVQGWVTGTGGSISIRFGNRIFMTPSGVQKERIQPEDLFVLDSKGNMLAVPSRKQRDVSRAPKLSECAPLFLVCFNHLGAGAALHSHDMNCNLVSVLAGSSEYRIRNQEMIKGIAGYGYRDELIIPIIENTPYEYELTASLERAVLKYPKTVAVLVRDHGIYVWGNTWEDAKRHAECLHYLFELSLKICHLVKTIAAPTAELDTPVSDGISHKRKRYEISNCKEVALSAISTPYKHIIFDIEGTTTPITFVKDTLFPYARESVCQYLRDNWNGSAQSDLMALLRQHSEDKNDKNMLNLPTLSAIPLTSEKVDFSELLLQAFTAYVQWNIDKDRKIKALKDLQGKLWKFGYESGKLRSIVYDDVPPVFQRLKDAGKNICIYSSGSRSAQMLLFKHSNHGDLRPFLSCYFDTSVGQKRSALSYREIELSLGVDSASEILFVTDIFEEAVAAREAGFGVVLSVRPGNTPLSRDQSFFCETVTNFNCL